MPDEVDPRLIEAERERSRLLQEGLRAERERVRAASAAEIAGVQADLREAARRTARREREVAALQAKLERKVNGGRLSWRRRRPAEPARPAEPEPVRLTDPEPAQPPEPEPMQPALAEHETAHARREEELRSREQELVEWERRVAERERLCARAERRAAPRAVPTGDSTFSDGLRALGSRSGKPEAADGAPGSW